MNPVAISALAALGGSSLGTLGTVLSNYVLQRSATRRDLMNHVFANRQTLYSVHIGGCASLPRAITRMILRVAGAGCEVVVGDQRHELTGNLWSQREFQRVNTRLQEEIALGN
jgi:hypothetical protein